MDITIRPPLTYAIRGKLLNMPSINPVLPAAGGPFAPEMDSLEIELEPRRDPAVRFRNRMPNGLVNVNPDKSTFEISGVLPGEYWVTARIAGKDARTPVDVSGKNVEGVAISFVTGFDVPIKVSLEGHPRGPDFERLLDSVGVSLGRAEGPEGIDAEEVPDQPGTFVARNVVPGEYSLAWMLAGKPPVYIKSVLVEGIPMQGRFRLDRPPLRPIEVVWGLAAGVITGMVTNSRLEPASDVTVVAISPNRGSYWATSSPDGRFKITAVPPGDFRLYAWEAIALYTWQDPEVMRRDYTRGIEVHLDDGGNATVNLTSIPPPVIPGR
jgi:hypothetical protein